MANDPYYRFNPFVEADMESLRNETNAGHKIFRVHARVYIDVEEISGEGPGAMWTHEWFYFSNARFDHLDAFEFERQHADHCIEMYYEGQRENGVVQLYANTISITRVEVYDNSNVEDIPLQGETYKTRLLRFVNVKEFITEKNKCLFDYICYKVLGTPGFVNGWSRSRMIKEFNGAEAISMVQLENWIKKGTDRGKQDKNISFYAWWENGKLAYKFQPNYRNKNRQSKPIIALNFIVVDTHAIPVENDKQFTPNKLKKMKTLTANMKDLEADINWTFDHHFNNYYYVDHDTFYKNES